MDEIKFEEIWRLCQKDSIYWTDHAGKRLIKRGISPNEVIDTLLNGSIIEQYPKDYPFPSCLIYACINNRPLHVVCSIGNDQLYIITAYEPTQASWDKTFTIRKKEEGFT